MELQQKRKAILKQETGQNLRLAESLLGILYARAFVSKSLYEAGCFFGKLGYRYEACLGEGAPKRYNILTRKEGRENLSDEKDERHTKAWRMALEALREAGSRPFQTVLEVVFYDQDLYTKVPPRVPIAPLRQGLAFLERYFKGEAIKDDQYKLDDRVENHGRSTKIQRSSTNAPLRAPPLYHG